MLVQQTWNKRSKNVERISWRRRSVNVTGSVGNKTETLNDHRSHCCLGKIQSDRLQKLQNRAGRIITSDYDVRSADILQTLGWDTLEQRRANQLAVSVYKAMNNIFPEELNSIFEATSQIHSYNLRGSTSNIYIPRPKMEAGKRSFGYRGAVLWNGLPETVRNKPTVLTFRNSL